MLKKFCHDQVKILLERMDTHPEEFIKGRKWEDFLPMSHGNPLISPRFKHFTKLEQYLIRQKYESLVIATLRQRAYDGILETLVFKEETNTERYYSTSNQPVLGTPTIYEATVDVTTGKMTEKITRIKSK
jgi:late competence protein required for DNA uptake (superfamily II DNA/RNA helicase)